MRLDKGDTIAFLSPPDTGFVVVEPMVFLPMKRLQSDVKISTPVLAREAGEIIYKVKVDSGRGSGDLWFSLPEAHAGLLSGTADAALLGLLIPAMSAGEDIRVDGPVSERLFYNLSYAVQRFLLVNRPYLREVRIHAECLDSKTAASGHGVATGFSGGIDSFCVLADHYYGEVPDSFRITHLLFNNVGSHGSGGERLFRERYQRLLPTANAIGLPFVMVNSNLHEFFPASIGFRKTHTFRNASVALLLQQGIRRFMYASAFQYADVSVTKTHAAGYGDLVSLPLLSTDALDMFSVGSRYTRVEKTLRVATVKDSYHALDVCANARNHSGFSNCSTCAKCLRTLATLDTGGGLDHYSTVFDLAVWRQRRNEYLASLPGSADPLMREIAELARARGVTIPLSSLVLRYIGITRIMQVMRRQREKKSRRV